MSAKFIKEYFFFSSKLVSMNSERDRESGRKRERIEKVGERERIEKEIEKVGERERE